IFFFQAEDGIRDFHVTGVQTCALPIFLTSLHGVFMTNTEIQSQSRLIEARKLVKSPLNVRRTIARSGIEELKASILAHGLMQNRSEERRVGKECREGWARYHER